MLQKGTLRSLGGALRRFAAPIGVATFLAPAPAYAAEPAGPSFAGPASAESAISGEIAVDLRDGMSDAEVAAFTADHRLSLRPNSRFSAGRDDLEVTDVAPASEAAVIDELARDPRVEHVEPMTLYRESFVPNDPLYATKQWHLQRVGAEAAWRYSCGAGVTVAVVDTGVACYDKGGFSRGSDLAGARCDRGWNFVDDSAEAYDDQGHGTHVAGTIAQTTDNGVGTAGLAYCATLMPVKVLNRQGFGTVANVAEGIRYAADQGAQVINLSLGGPIKSQILEDAVKHALSRGVVVVAAAGNSGRSVGWPAAYPGVVAVSATDSNDKLAWFSSRGPEVVLAAPGVAVTQQTICNGGRDKCEVFAAYNGTSMAAPHVAGAAAMVEALGVTDAGAVRDALSRTARPQGDEDLFGAGILDVGAATARVFWGHLLLRLFGLAGLGVLVARRIRRRGRSTVFTAGSALASAATSVGLLALAPWLGWPAHAVATHTWLSLAAHPLGEWDLLLFGASAHRWLLLASALPALGLTALGFASRRMRPLIGGVALGTAALLLQMAWSGDVAFIGGALLGRLWALGNLAVCVWLARMALESERPRV